MKKYLIGCFLLSCSASFAFYYPNASLHLGNVPTTVFYGETLTVPLTLKYFALGGFKLWSIPGKSMLQSISGHCPTVPYDVREWGTGVCNMKLLIPGTILGEVISGILNYHIWGNFGRKPHYYEWNYTYYSPEFRVTVIPHPLGVQSIPEQNATANQPFIFPIKSAVRYYEENQRAGAPAQAIVQPVEQYGLYFDLASFSIKGIPTRIGRYVFKIGVFNKNGTTQLTDLVIHVHANSHDKPQFKSRYSMVSALPQKKYAMNLLELVESHHAFWTTNQVSFHIDANQSNAPWLQIAPDEPTVLTGTVPSNAAGQDVWVTLIARSNTGGDSDSLMVKIPIAYDPEKTPEFIPFKLNTAAGSDLHEDLTPYVKDPTGGDSLKIVLDSVEPAAPWLHMTHNTVLKGSIPKDAFGQKFYLSLRASNPIGGSSDAIKIPLQIDWDPKQKPVLKNNLQELPPLYPGQPYYYDFEEQGVVMPEYKGTPYEVHYSDDFLPPSWLRLEHNKLVADFVPEIQKPLAIKIVIKNIPGGVSDIYVLVMPST